MRKIFIDTLITLARKDKSIYLLNGDLGFSVLEVFEKEFPKRYINCGIAEQNMMGIAAGLALEGKKVYVYSIIPFATFRCFEQLRNDISYHNLNVKIIGAGAGLAYGILGPTHFAVEDIAVVRTLPHMIILSPSDPLEMEQLVLQSYKMPNPTYIRMDKSDATLHKPSDTIILGNPSVISKGSDGIVITTGSYLRVIINAVEKLKKEGRNLKVVSLHTLKPVNQRALLKEIKGQKIVFTIEEHKLVGGVGSIVGEILLQNNINDVMLKSIGIEDTYSPIIGKQDYLRKYYKIDEDNVYKKILTELKKI